MEFVFHQYPLDTVSGKSKLDPLDNARYPDIKPVKVRGFVRRFALD